MDFIQELAEYTRLRCKVDNEQPLTEDEQCSHVVLEQVLQDNGII